MFAQSISRIARSSVRVSYRSSFINHALSHHPSTSSFPLRPHDSSLGSQGISTSAPRLDVARVTLVGRLGADPVVRTSEKTGVQYVVYPIATSTGPLGPADADGSESEFMVLLVTPAGWGRLCGLGGMEG